MLFWLNIYILYLFNEILYNWYVKLLYVWVIYLFLKEFYCYDSVNENDII